MRAYRLVRMEWWLTDGVGVRVDPCGSRPSAPSLVSIRMCRRVEVSTRVMWMGWTILARAALSALSALSARSAVTMPTGAADPDAVASADADADADPAAPDADPDPDPDAVADATPSDSKVE